MEIDFCVFQLTRLPSLFHLNFLNIEKYDENRRFTNNGSARSFPSRLRVIKFEKMILAISSQNL